MQVVLRTLLRTTRSHISTLAIMLCPTSLRMIALCAMYCLAERGVLGGKDVTGERGELVGSPSTLHLRFSGSEKEKIMVY